MRGMTKEETERTRFAVGLDDRVYVSAFEFDGVESVEDAMKLARPRARFSSGFALHQPSVDARDGSFAMQPAKRRRTWLGAVSGSTMADKSSEAPGR